MNQRGQELQLGHRPPNSRSLVILRTKVLPAWLGWVAFLLGIVSLTPAGFFAFLVVLAWIAVVSWMLYQQQSGQTPAPQTTLPTG